MTQNIENFPEGKTNRIVLFADLRDSTDILINFEQGIYGVGYGASEADFTYEEFILDVHETSYKELYLGHEETYSEIYGDGVMGILPEDNGKYLLENIYRLSRTMRAYQDSPGVGISKPRIDIGFGVTLGMVSFVYFPLDKQHHPVGQCIHEAARIEGLSKFYDARILISHKFFNYTEGYIDSDPRFSYRFVDRIILKGFREPITLFELLVDNDPRFDIKISSISDYSNAYSKYCEGKWEEAREMFLNIYHEYGLGIGTVMAERCDIHIATPPSSRWNGIWKLKDK